jgi:hypothetical protein
VATLILVRAGEAHAAPLEPTPETAAAAVADGSRPSIERPTTEAPTPRRSATDALGRVAVVLDGHDTPAIEREVAGADGRVTAEVSGGVTALVDESAVAHLSRSASIESVWLDQAPIVQEVSEGALDNSLYESATNASIWHLEPFAQRGANVRIGIIDVGFSGFDDLPAADRPPDERLIPNNTLCPGDMFGPSADPHGSAVAEIAYDMAPAATFYLVCVDFESDLAAAADYLGAQGVKVVNMSLGFTDGRGDGSAFQPGRAAEVVRRTRLQYGLLWVISAGNSADAHYNVSAGDSDGDGYVEITPQFPGASEFFLMEVAPTTIPSQPSTGSVDIRWDAWFGSPQNYLVELWDVTTAPPVLVDTSNFPQGPSPPIETVEVANPRAGFSTYAIVVRRVSAGATPRRFDLFFFGDVTRLDAVTASGSVTEPATSPYALAVAAHCYDSSSREFFSSTGPTIDGRIKPDISAPDGVTTRTYGAVVPETCDPSLGFFGTSAAAPHAAGAAALLLGANPDLDVAELQAELEASTVDKAAPGADNESGFGFLTLADPPATPVAPVGELYRSVGPVRIMDTRRLVGVCSPAPCARLGAGETRNLQVADLTGVDPDTVSAVVLNVTVVGPTAPSFLTVFPFGQGRPRVSSLNFRAGEVVTNHVTATVGEDGFVSLFNAGGQAHVVVDLAGFYSPAGTVGLVAMDSPGRMMDTRPGGCVGGPRCGRLGPGETVELPVRGVSVAGTVIPADAEAVVLNVIGVNATAGTFLTVWPEGPWPGVSSLNPSPGVTRVNLVIATIGADGNIRVRNAGGQIDVVVDVMGWYAPGGSGYVALNPRRTLDTRTGTGPRFGALSGGEQFDHQVQLLYSVPDDATAALMNVTAVTPAGPGFLTIFPDGLGSMPRTSSLNFGAGQTVPNAVITGIGDTPAEPGQPTGQITIYNNPSSPATPVLVDLAGYFT